LRWNSLSKSFSYLCLARLHYSTELTHYIVNRKGKQMRPMFVFLVAKMLNNGEVSERTYRGASVIELIHTATLVHDNFRRLANKGL
jgi:octaprenyl-diphosphate synthase